MRRAFLQNNPHNIMFYLVNPKHHKNENVGLIFDFMAQIFGPFILSAGSFMK